MKKVIRLTENDLSKIVKRVIIESVDYYDKIVNILEPPYFKNLRSIGISEDHWETIFSKVFNKPVEKFQEYLFDSNDNQIYFEDSNGDWYKREYDNNGNLIYRENSDGEWNKYEYDENDNVVYYEDSYGLKRGERNNGNLNESTDDIYYDKIVNILEPPYFKNLRSIGIDEYQWETILSKVFNKPVEKFPDSLYDEKGNEIYYEDSDGFWYKYEYDDNGNEIYHETSYGGWCKYEYNSSGDVVYYENSFGEINDYRDNNLNESTDDRYYDKLLSILQPPYFENLITIGISEDHWDNILSKVYGYPVSYGKINDEGTTFRIYDEINNGIYDEVIGGRWVKKEYHENGNVIYYENSDGEWYKSEYDDNGNEIYYESSNGYWEKSEYDDNGNKTYYEDSDGYWFKYEYDSNGNQIYHENSTGYVFDRRNKNLNESVDHYDKLLTILQPPYIENLNILDISKDHYEKIFSKLYNDDVSITYNDTWGEIKIFNSNGKVLYSENSYGRWDKSEYDSNGNEIYFENYKGNWSKSEYDDNGNQIYRETSEGNWEKSEYDDNGNEIYYENSYGYWVKREYDSNGDMIYYESSDSGVLRDRRNKNLNESTDDKYYDKIVNILDKPYYQNLSSIGIDEDKWEIILSKVFNQPIERYQEYLYNSNGNQIYYENSYGYWTKREYDSNGYKTYLESSDGEWVKYEYDNNGNLIYRETSDGEWYKYEYDENDNVVYYEDYNGVWYKYEYDNNDNETYFESSSGVKRGKRNNNLNESVDDKYYDKLLNILKRPYFRNLESMGISEDQYETIFSRLFGEPVLIYMDENQRSGYWRKRIFNERDDIIYYEDSNGGIDYSEYDENGNLIYSENSDGDWSKYEYDSNGNIIYREDSDGLWYKWGYDSNGNKIYFETSEDGVVLDNRNNNLNESTDYYGKLLNVLQPPYFSNLRTMGFSEDEIKDILEKIFDEELVIEDTSGTIWVSNLNDKEIYYEDKWRNDYWFIKQYNDNGKISNYNNSDGYWSKYEYDDNGNQIYFENSNGEWEKREYDSNGKLIKIIIV